MIKTTGDRMIARRSFGEWGGKIEICEANFNSDFPYQNAV